MVPYFSDQLDYCDIETVFKKWFPENRLRTITNLTLQKI
jgi:hypothetical protein